MVTQVAVQPQVRGDGVRASRSYHSPSTFVVEIGAFAAQYSDKTL